MLPWVTMASFSGQVATPRWNMGASETPLPSPPRKFPTFEGGGLQKPPPFLFADDLLQMGRQHGVQTAILALEPLRSQSGPYIPSISS